MKRIPKGGPVTKAGKKVSSRNSTTHGLTAKRWSNSTEQENYHAFLAALIVDFQPKTVIEHTLIEKLADTRTRLDRFHHVEDALFTLAQERAESPDHVVNSFGVVDDQGVLEELSDHSFGIPYRYDPIPKKLFKELINHDLSDVSGWGYITDNMPVLREHIIEECRKHNVDVEDLMSRHKVQEDSSGVLNIVIRDYEKPKLLTEQTLEESRLKIRKESFIAYIKTLFAQTKRHNRVNALIKDFDNRAKLLKRSALPDGPSLDRLMRYRTTLERQFSKTLGELLHIINLRER